MDKKKQEIIKSTILIMSVVILGLFAMNLVFKIYYNIDNALNPCDLCFELNPELECRVFNSSLVIDNSTIKIINISNWNEINHP